MTGGSRGTPPGIRTEHLVVQHNGNRSGEGKGGVREVTSVTRDEVVWKGRAGYYHDKSSPSWFLPGYPGAWDRNSGGPVAGKGGTDSPPPRKDLVRDEVRGDDTTCDDGHEETYLRREKRRATSHEDLEAVYADEALRKQTLDSRLEDVNDTRPTTKRERAVSGGAVAAPGAPKVPYKRKRVASYHQATLRRYRRNIAEAINLSCSQDDAVSRRFCSPVRVMIRGTRDNPPLLRVLQATLYGLVTSIQRIDDPEILAGTSGGRVLQRILTRESRCTRPEAGVAISLGVLEYSYSKYPLCRKSLFQSHGVNAAGPQSVATDSLSTS
ncbi:hypothetical protein ALC53_10383 [Atta colombica]|uniref:Uncharacterized protein n=1 Tax=Atta colombica TaxID=520822 RepID=A0A195B403_9HYME|nr:hypothetical protein ALC53_10383 [Atta colombica]